MVKRGLQEGTRLIFYKKSAGSPSLLRNETVVKRKEGDNVSVDEEITEQKPQTEAERRKDRESDPEEILLDATTCPYPCSIFFHVFRFN